MVAESEAASRWGERGNVHGLLPDVGLEERMSNGGSCSSCVLFMAIVCPSLRSISMSTCLVRFFLHKIARKGRTKRGV